MDYVPPVNDLEQRLKEAGEQLTFPPSSTNNLLDLLDKTEHLLTFVSQAPSISMQGALVPSMGALIDDGLLKHSEIDVRVLVASCLCEVARITAPEPPYRDEIMKEIFQLNVLAFGQLSNVTGQSYHKAIHILESVAKVKSCLLMLDLECDALVLEMFEQFLREIRVNHPRTVFSDIEAIMTIVIEESDEVATELLSLLICHVKKENEIVTPASWKVAEKVLRNCNNTLKSYTETILKLINSNLDDYAEVVTVLCQNAQENGHMATRSTRTNSTHKRDLNTLENGGSMKKQKLIDENLLKGKKLETSSRGRPKKNKYSSNQDSCLNSVQNSKEDTRRTRVKDKRQSSKTKGNFGNSGSLYNVVIKKEDVFISDHEGAEPFMQQTNNKKTPNRRKPSANKRLANGSRGKDTSKKWGQELVGRRVKVWWPLDKMYYEGAVSSYNHVDQKHKVLYADGDEEVLDLHREKWQILDEIPPDQEQVADLPSPMTTPRRPTQKRKRKPESSLKQVDNSSSPKSPPPADSSETVDVICNTDNQKNGSRSIHVESSKTTDVTCNADNQKSDPLSTPADSSKTEDVICNTDNQKNDPLLTPTVSTKTEDVICDAENQKNYTVSRPADFSKTGDVICNDDNQKDDPVLTPADSSKTKDLICNAGNQKNDPVSILADSSKTEDVICDAENQKYNLVSTPADLSKIGDVVCNDDNSKDDPVSTPADSSKTEDVICNADNQKNIPVLTPVDSSKTKDVICNADNQKNIPVSTPTDSSKIENVICNADNQKNNPVSPLADSSKTTDVTCNADNQKNTLLLTPAGSSKTEDVICNADNQKNDPISTPADSSKTEDVTCNADNHQNIPEKNW